MGFPEHLQFSTMTAAATTRWQGRGRVRQLNDVIFFSDGQAAEAQMKTCWNGGFISQRK
jgi:hypothetical protein